jgi:hypothetical protein
MIGVVSCLTVTAIGATLTFGKDQRSAREYSASELRAKYGRLNTSTERVDRLKERGYLPKAIEEAKNSVAIAEEEFGMASLTVINPLLTLIELLGRQKLYEEAEMSINKMYAIIDVDDEALTGYAIGYRIRIAQIYVQWNMFEKGESTLISAQNIIKASTSTRPKDSRYVFTTSEHDQYTQSINTLLAKIHTLKEANRYNAR